MKSHNLTEAVVFWRWTAPNNIAIVTGSAVYHWSIEGESPPQKVFDRHEKLLDSCQIINYQVSADGKWCLLMGIKAGAEANVVDGVMQLYSIDQRVSQVLNGHTGVFTTMKPEGRTDEAQVRLPGFLQHFIIHHLLHRHHAHHIPPNHPLSPAYHHSPPHQHPRSPTSTRHHPPLPTTTLSTTIPLITLTASTPLSDPLLRGEET